MGQFHENRKYELLIDTLNTAFFETKEIFPEMEPFWNVKIPISQHLYYDLKEYPDMMLLVDHPETELLIPNFSTYFQHDIDISYISEEQIGDEVVVSCILNDIACFPIDDPNSPF